METMKDWNKNQIEVHEKGCFKARYCYPTVMIK